MAAPRGVRLRPRQAHGTKTIFRTLRLSINGCRAARNSDKGGMARQSRDDKLVRLPLQRAGEGVRSARAGEPVECVGSP